MLACLVWCNVLSIGFLDVLSNGCQVLEKIFCSKYMSVTINDRIIYIYVQFNLIRY